MMRLVMLVLVLLCHLLFAIGRAPPPSRPYRDVVTTQGVVRGYLTPQPAHYAFLGVPYGRPPTRHDRFKGSKPAKRWDGIYEATYRVKCPQPGGEGDENCLVVNIFASEGADGLPVLVLVHDGAFQYGWGSYQPPARLLPQFLIVTFNYRIGALGFLCLGTPDLPGNAGLKDQIAALYWIQRNIANFGGNPADVTAYGVGAGAAAIDLILLSNLSQGLLHKVILETGSALSPISTAYDPVTLAIDAAAVLDYSGSEEDNELAVFFQRIPAKEISKTGKMFLPCIERKPDGMFEKDPVDILKSGNYHRVPMIIVYTDKILVTEMDMETFGYMPQSFEHLLPNNLEFPVEDVKEKIAEFVRDFYFAEEDSKDDLVKNYIDYFRDITVEFPVLRSAVYHTHGSTVPVYVMKFMYNSNFASSDSNFMDNTLLNYFYETDLSGNDELVAQKLVSLWSNFIKIGDPTPLTTTMIPVVWPPVHSSEQNHHSAPRVDLADVPGLEFGGTMMARNTLSTQQVIFWDNIYKSFYRKH